MLESGLTFSRAQDTGGQILMRMCKLCFLMHLCVAVEKIVRATGGHAPMGTDVSISLVLVHPYMLP